MLRLALWRTDRPCGSDDTVTSPPPAGLAGRVVVAIRALLMVTALVGFALSPAAPLAESQWQALIPLLALHLWGHELAHVASAVRHGVRIREIGAGLLFGVIPVMYSDRTDGYRLKEIAGHVRIALAGPAFDLTAAGVTAIVASVTDGTWRATALTLLASQVLLFTANLNPLLPTDGYHAIEAALGWCNVRRRAFTTLLCAVTRRPLPSALARQSRTTSAGYLAYAVVASLFTAGLVFWFLQLGWSVFLVVRGALA